MRRVASAALGVVAVVALMLGSVGLWARGALFDSDAMVEAIGRTYSEPDTRAVLSGYITTQAMRLLDADALVSDALPDRLDPLTPMITGGLESRINSLVESMLASDQALRLVEAASRQAHESTMRVLAGGNLIGGVSARDSEVSLNLVPLIARALAATQRLGVLNDVDIPEFERGGNPVEQIDELSEALGRNLPENFGQLVVYRGERVEAAQSSVSMAQRLLVIAKRVMWLALAVAVAAGAGAIVLASSKSRGAFYLGTGVAVAAVLLRSAVLEAIDQSALLVKDPAAQAALRSLLGYIGAGLPKLLGVMALFAAAVALAGLVVNRFARPLPAVALGGAAMVAVVTIAGASVFTVTVAVAVALLVALTTSMIWRVTPPDVEVGRGA